MAETTSRQYDKLDALLTNRSVRSAVVATLLMVFAGQAILSMQRKSVTTDEMMYIAVGYYHLQTGDFTLNMTNTPLIKVMSAVPLLFMRPELPPMRAAPAELSIVEQWQWARAFIYENRVDADRMIFAARVPVVLLGVVLGVFVFLWASELFGARGGVAALVLYSFCPNLIAHARLATHDFGLTAFMFIAAYLFWQFQKQPSWRRAVGCGVVTGLALLSKSTAIFLAPVFGGFVLYNVLAKRGLGLWDKMPWLLRIRGERMQLLWSGFSSLVVIGLVALLTLNVGYGFQGTFSSLRSQFPEEGRFNRPALRAVASVPLPVPSPFVNVFVGQRDLTSANNSVYFAGRLYRGGLWYLTPAALALKSPLPLLLLLLAGVALVFRRRPLADAEWLLWIYVLLVLFVFCFVVQVNASVRYVLPILPALILLAARVVDTRIGRHRLGFALVALLLAWHAVGTLRVFPNYLAYFNEFAGGPSNGYKYLTDSNLDWGQDLKALKGYLDEQRVDTVNLGYFGSADANYYGIRYRYLPSVGLEPTEPGQQWWYEMTGPAARIEPEPGVYAISATLIASPGWMPNRFYDAYSWFRDRRPDDQVGHSIHIFRVPPDTSGQ